MILYFPPYFDNSSTQNTKKPLKRVAFKGCAPRTGRDERIRTSDFLHPMQALYQAELRPENTTAIYRPNKKCKQKVIAFCNIYL